MTTISNIGIKVSEKKKQKQKNLYTNTQTNEWTDTHFGTIISEVPKAIKMTRKHSFFKKIGEEVNTRCLFHKGIQMNPFILITLRTFAV